jgi:hypothetical protein
MLTSPAEHLRSHDRPTGPVSREPPQDIRVRSGAVPRVDRGGDTDALDWRSDPHLLAILARGVNASERLARTTSSHTAVTSSTSQHGGLEPAHTHEDSHA